MSVETHSDGDEIACHHVDCGKTWADLWDYAWGTREEIETECPHCGKAITLGRAVTIDYRASVRT